MKGNAEYEIQVSAATKSLSKPHMTRLGNMSAKATIFLPNKACDDNRVLGQEQFSAGMIGGAICAVLFLMLAVVGFIVWR